MNPAILMGLVVQYFRHQAKTRKPLRFGQFYINEYMPADTKWPELFYETDNAKAILMIAEQIELARKKSEEVVDSK